MVFSHQKQVVESLAVNFSSTTVITREKDPFLDKTSGLHALSWKRQNSLLSIVTFYIVSLNTLLRRQNISVLFLQTDFEAALISPILYLAKIRSSLWYAHGHSSNYLRFASRFVGTILTANKESCALKTPKLRIVGHMIDPDLFPLRSHDSIHKNLKKFFHLGRGDISKRIDLIMKVVNILSTRTGNVSLTLIGESSSAQSKISLQQSLDRLKQSNPNLVVFFKGWIARDLLREELSNLGIFVHAFQGSLDKAILESTLNLNPVATINIGYLREFGSWSNQKNQSDLEFLVSEVEAILMLSKKHLQKELLRRRQIVLERHCLSNWTTTTAHLIR